jgi:hypothetical protein
MMFLISGLPHVSFTKNIHGKVRRMTRQSVRRIVRGSNHILYSLKSKCDLAYSVQILFCESKHVM